MLENSKDLVWIALAFAILWISIFVGWGAYYLAMVLRDVSLMTASIRKKLTIVDEILKKFKDRAASTASYLPPIIEGISRVIEKVRDSQEKSKSKKENSKKTAK